MCEWGELQGDLSCFLYVILGEGPLGNKEWTLSLWIKGVSIIPSSVVFFFGVLEDLLCVLYVILGEESPSNKEWTLSLWIKGVFIIPSSIFSIVLEDSASKASSEGESPSAKHPIIMHQLRPPFLGVHHMIIKRNFFYSRQGCKIGSHQAYSLYWIASIHELIVDNLSTYKEHIPCIIYATPNALKSCTM